MNIKNVIIYILIVLIGFLSQLICYIIYPVIFLFRYKIEKYINSKIEEDLEHRIYKLKQSVKKYQLYFSPLFWGFLFTTGLDEITQKCCGPLWYKKEQKLKWFTNFFVEKGINCKYPIPKTFKQKLQFFGLSYCWSGFRNATWALTEWFFKEGIIPQNEINVYKSKMRDKSLDINIMPSISFKDKDGTDRNNSGPYIKYTFDSENEWEALQEGTKILTFITYTGKERFYYGKVKVFKLDKIKKFLVMELLFGWNPYNGVKTYASRFMFKKIDDFALQDYNKYKYLEYIKNFKK
jgi:hypothetical protein